MKQQMKLKPKNQKVAKAVAAIYEATLDRQRGELITHEEIERWSGIDRYDAGWNLLIIKLKKKFEAKPRGITLDPVIGVGYKLLTVIEQITDKPEDRALRALRQLRRGIGHMEAIQEPLTNHQQNLRAAKVTQCRNAMRQVRIARRVSKSLGKPSGRG